MPTPKSERRFVQRVPARVPVTIQSLANPSVTGFTRDLSMSGIFLYADAEILVGSDLEMVLMLPAELTDGEKRWVCCQASVIRVEPSGEDGRFGVAANIKTMAALPEILG
jgi:PilZ domain-containing protein